MSVDIMDETIQKRCVPTPLQTEARPMAAGTWQMNFSMAIGMQWMRIRPMAVGAQRSSGNLDTEATHSYHWKMTKT